MNGLALAAPIYPDKVEEWKAFSYGLTTGPKGEEFKAFVEKCGLSRVRCWLQETVDGPMAIILYEGGNPESFLKEMQTSSDPFCHWFQEQVRTLHKMDLKQPGQRAQLVTDVQV